MFFKSLIATLTGENTAQATIDEAAKAQVRPHRIQFLHSRLLMNQGEFGTAIDDMERAVQERDDDVALMPPWPSRTVSLDVVKSTGHKWTNCGSWT